MKRKNMVVGCLLIVAILFIGLEVFSEPGTSNDPLVSMSYVDKKVEEIKRYIDNKVSGLGNNSGPTTVTTSNLDVVELSKGQSIIGGNGTEIILRSGEAVAIGSDLGGVSDVTGGKDINSGLKVSKNHLLIIPRDDGRGVYAKTECFFMVRGQYVIQ